VHAPHRWYALEEEIHGVNQLRIVGGVSNCCLQHGLNFYDGNINNYKSSIENYDEVSIKKNASERPSSLITSESILELMDKMNYRVNLEPINNEKEKYGSIPVLEIPMHPVSSVEVAELTKIIENAHRYLQIAFAEELYLYCKSNGISFPELRESLNTKWNVDILEPRDGIGGHCLPKDTKMFINSSNTMKSKILQAAMEIDEDYRDLEKIVNLTKLH
ncbi:hypothetical protein E5N71_04855, partial [Candidatus Nitrosocosmicus sp. SS]